MKIKLPKQYRGMFFPKLFSIEMNNFAVEMLLPSLFFLTESRGKQRREKSDSENISEYISKLCRHSRIEGFSDPVGERVLEKWARTSLLVTGKKGRERVGTQILFLQPLTYLTFKAGFPTESSRLRNVNYFLYRYMIDALVEQSGEESERSAYETVRGALRQSFAEGIENLPQGMPGAEVDGVYDGHTALDTETLLCTLFMDSFPPAKISNRKSEARPPVCKGQAKRFMRAFVKFIQVFKDRMPARELIYNLQTLINFELCIYTLKLAYGTNHLILTGEIPDQFTTNESPNGPEIFVDFTDSSKGFSRELARRCVSRDLQELSQFFSSILRLRALDRFVENNPRFESQLTERDPIDYLQTLIELQENQHIQAKADNVIDEIVDINTSDNEEPNEMFNEFRNHCNNLYPEDSIDRLVLILDEAQRNSGGRKVISWFKSVSGVEKRYGFIKGPTRRRNSWAYAPSNDLLWTLVHLAATKPDDPRVDKPKKIRFADFLEFLKTRYGIIVNQVPQGMESIEANKASRDNLLALQIRLRKMGLFDNLSDDFEAQYINPQYRHIRRNDVPSKDSAL